MPRFLSPRSIHTTKNWIRISSNIFGGTEIGKRTALRGQGLRRTKCEKPKGQTANPKEGNLEPFGSSNVKKGIQPKDCREGPPKTIHPQNPPKPKSQHAFTESLDTPGVCNRNFATPRRFFFHHEKGILWQETQELKFKNTGGQCYILGSTIGFPMAGHQPDRGFIFPIMRIAHE